MSAVPIGPVLRRAGPADAAAVATFFRRCFRAAWTFIDDLHTPAEDRDHLAACIARGPVWLAEDGGDLVGFVAARRGWIDHLFVAPERQGGGLGAQLLGRALRGSRRVRLWTFQRNTGARAFYAAQGFRELRLTDGAANEEHEPDVLLEWVRPPGGRARPFAGP